jgi:hypothetical protein
MPSEAQLQGDQAVMPKCLRDILTEAEATAIENAPPIGLQRHPTWYPIFDGQSSATNDLTNGAVFRIALVGDIAWLQQLPSRLTRIDDPEEAAAALGELRAYGALLQAGFKVTPIPRSTDATADFSVNAGDGEVIVEVFTKHQDEDQAQLQADIAEGRATRGVQRGTMESSNLTVHTTISSIQPGGAPDKNKPHDSVQANVISRVCAAKAKELQLPDDASSLLWIDFHSFGPWPAALSSDQASPLISGNNGFTSGALWYGFYGWRGAPIFEEDFFPQDRVFPMGHDGRFRLTGKRKSKLSGSILALSSGLLLFENPWATHPLPDFARRYCERLPQFDFGRSVCNWSPGDTLVLAELGRRQIESIARWREVLTGDA